MECGDSGWAEGAALLRGNRGVGCENRRRKKRGEARQDGAGYRVGGNHGAGDADRVAGFEEERRGADFAERSSEPAAAVRGGFVQGYTAELVVSAIFILPPR